MFKNWNNGKCLLVITALSLLISFIFTATVVQAWPWRTAWATFKVKNRTGQTVNRIIGGGISAFAVTRCLDGRSPKFPDCWTGSIYIELPDIPPFWLTGYYFGTRTTAPDVKRKIGFGRKFCVEIVGVGVWLKDYTPKKWPFPLVGIKCTSPVSFVVDDSMPEPLQPFRVTDVEYALTGYPIPFDSLDYDNPLPWEPTSLQDTAVYPGDSIPIPDLPPEDIILDSVLFLRGHLIAEIDTGGGIYVDTVDFAVEILEEPTGACCVPDSGCVDSLTWEECQDLGGRYMGNGTTCDEVQCPTLTQWGLIVLVALIVFSTWVVLRRRKAVVSRQ